MNRRHWLTNVLGGTAMAAAVVSGSEVLAQPLQGRRRQQGERTLKKYDNSHFYNADGSFNEKAAKEAYIELLRFHRYSLPGVVDDERFWIRDFGLGDFANVGMGGIFWLNDKEHGYFGHEIYLLPFQMIPEHAHVAAEDKPPKHEYWQVRHGSIYNFGKGGSKDDLSKLPVPLPKSQLDANAITAFTCVELKAGTGKESEAAITGLGDYHFMMGGPQGAIVTEYASFHAGTGLKFQNPKGVNDNTKAKQ
ncbi:MAG: hypothetical protein LBC02_02050 [Planctomycetaceae bacterium]|jgi:D-lyxose ketol-isomerase|nr:hypothetical protein [Planctomycetaceae bacterium]